MGGIVMLVILLMVWAVYLGYPLIAVLLGLYVRRKLRRQGKGIGIASLVGFMTASILIFLPFADYPWQRYKLEQYCSQESGFTITGYAEAVEGIHGLRHAIDYGYSYGELYEIANNPSTLWRFHAAKPGSNTGKFIRTKPDDPSPYGYRRERLRIDGTIYRVTLQTYRTDTDEELGRFVYFQNDPTGQDSTINDLRKWMRMTCAGVEHGAFAQLRVLLSKTLIPAE